MSVSTFSLATAFRSPESDRIRIMLAWGMTEITPIGTVTALKSDLERLPDDERFDFLARHGIPLAGIRSDSHHARLGHDGNHAHRHRDRLEERPRAPARR